MRPSISAVVSATCVLVVSTSFAVAQGGGERRPISGPMVITEPGRYIVTNDLSGSNGEHCVLSIATDGVDIDLGGFVVDGDEYEHCLCASDVKGLVVANGTLVVDSQDDEPTALVFYRVSRFTLRDITLHSTEDYLARIQGSSQGLIENCRFLRSREYVIISGSQITIRGCYLPKYLGLGLDRSLIVDNTLAMFPEDQFTVGEIRLSGSNNRVVGNKAAGLHMGSTAHGNVVLGNVFNLNAYSAIFVAGDRNQIFDNTLMGSRLFGLHFTYESSGNSYGGNVGFENRGDECKGAGSTPSFCDEGTGNLSAGGNYLPDRR